MTTVHLNGIRKTVAPIDVLRHTWTRRGAAMQVYFGGEAVIRHRLTGEHFTIDADELSWELVDAEEENMGERRHFAATIEHPELGPLTWHLWEYPIGTEEDHDTDANGHQVIQNLTFGLEHTPEEDDQREQLIAAIVEWFHGRYEDPAQRTSYNGREGGYLWDHGGPFDARTEIEENYREVPEYILEAAVAEIESDGTVEWAGGDWWDEEDGYPYDDESDGIFSINEPLPDISNFNFEDDHDDQYGPGDDSDELALPDQGVGIRFVLSDNGTIGLARPDLPSDGLSAIQTILPELQASAKDLVALLNGSNTYPTLAGLAARYTEAISGDNLAIGLIYALGVRLENSYKRIEVEILKGELPTLPPDTGEALDSVLSLHGPMILSTSEGRQLFDQSNEFRRSDAETEQYRAVAEKLVEAIVQTPDLVERDAANLVAAINEDVGTGPHPARTLQAAHGANRNLLLTIGAVAGACVTGVIGTAFVASEPGLLAVGTATQAMNAAWGFLQVNAPILREFIAASGGADMGWLSALLRKMTRNTD